jgi:hypothetical protein
MESFQFNCVEDHEPYKRRARGEHRLILLYKSLMEKRFFHRLSHCPDKGRRRSSDLGPPLSTMRHGFWRADASSLRARLTAASKASHHEPRR